MEMSVRDWIFMSGSSWSARREVVLSEDCGAWLMNDGCVDEDTDMERRRR